MQFIFRDVQLKDTKSNNRKSGRQRYSITKDIAVSLSYSIEDDEKIPNSDNSGQY